MNHTIEWWFNQLPEPFRTQALQNMQNPNDQVNSLHAAIDAGMNWSMTPQGHIYWGNLSHVLQH